FEELDEVLAGDAAVLAAWDAVAAEPAGVKPLAHRSGRDFTDLGDLPGGKDFLHVGHSNLCVLSPLPCRRLRVRRPGILHPSGRASRFRARLRERPPGFLPAGSANARPQAGLPYGQTRIAPAAGGRGAECRGLSSASATT